MAKKNYSFRFKEDVMNDIQKIADDENRTSTNLIETTLIELVKKKKKSGSLKVSV